MASDSDRGIASNFCAHAFARLIERSIGILLSAQRAELSSLTNVATDVFVLDRAGGLV